MYKVILVDDEEWVVESLKSSIIWEDYGFQIVGQVYRAEDAIALIAEIKPDLVFTDIKMPGMSGLDLLKRVKISQPNICFVVASGHAEFVYAQKAMQYGAIGFCLKPFEENEIMDCLHKARLVIEASKKQREPELQDLLFHSEPLDIKQIQALLWSNGVHLEFQELAVVQTNAQNSLGISCPFPHQSFKLGSNRGIYIINQANLSGFIEYLTNSTPMTNVGYQEHVAQVTELKKAMELVKIASLQWFISGKKIAYAVIPTVDHELRACLKQLYQVFEHKNLSVIDLIFDEVKQLFQTKAYTIKHAFYVYHQISNYLNDWFLVQPEIELESYEQLPLHYGHVDEMTLDLARLIKLQISATVDTVSPEAEHRTIREMVKYVNQNFYKDVNIQQLARTLFVTPNYISHLFKKEMGINFTEYITKLRIDYACRLLQESKHSIQQISEMSGFNDYFYFTRIFKKISGKTPTEFKKGAIES